MFLSLTRDLYHGGMYVSLLGNFLPLTGKAISCILAMRGILMQGLLL